MAEFSGLAGRLNVVWNQVTRPAVRCKRIPSPGLPDQQPDSVRDDRTLAVC